MIIVISPSKTQDFSPTDVEQHTQAGLLSQSQILIETLRTLSVTDLGALMKISPKLSELTHQRVKDFQQPFSLANAKQALLAFKGDVYSGIDSDNYSRADFDYAQTHLRILSGLYGALKPLDLIQPYRLEMGTRLENPRGKQLYQFWDSRVTEQLNQDLSKDSEPLLINLASNEYYKVVQKKHLKAPILTVHFKENKNGQYKVIGVHAKRARGQMVDFIIKQRIEQPEGLKAFNWGEYQFNADLSDSDNWVFSRG